MSSRVLVVSKNLRLREQFVHWLNEAGHPCLVCADFRSARQELDVTIPELLITDVRLDAFNGLHLVIWTRAQGMPTKSILIGEPDFVLQREADREGAVYLSPPFQQQEFMVTVASILARYHPIRRSPRKAVRLDAVIDGIEVSVVNLSYEGLGIEIPEQESRILPMFFTLNLPGVPIACRLQRVWIRKSPTSPRSLRCGAVLPMPDSDVASPWRHLVDTIPSPLAVVSQAAVKE
ncbi:MAG: hypothetical protein AB7N65_00855 [Vicinamibacterales bacterium]